MEDLTGRQFGPYQIVAPLGEGGMAAVYKAYQPAMERYVAMKVLPRHLADDTQFVARFQREAKLLAHLQHPHILPVFDYGQAEGYTYIVMPLVQTGTLTDTLQRSPLPLPRIRQVISQVGEALDYAHRRGLVHRDVKPSNILIDESGNSLLTDFGLARMVEATVNLTTSGTMMGTPAYMSPEQGSGQKIDARSDIYSIGVVLYEMATGRVPYRAETPVAVVFKHIHDPLPPPRTFNRDLPEAVERVILKALSKRPEDRYQTAGDMVQAIRVAIPDLPPGSSKTAKLTRPAAPTQGQTPERHRIEARARTPVEKAARLMPAWAWAMIAVIAFISVAGGLLVAGGLRTNQAAQTTAETAGADAVLSTGVAVSGNTPKPSGSPSPINNDPSLYDTFDNPTFDGRLDPSLWFSTVDSPSYAEQRGGILILSLAPDAEEEGSVLPPVNLRSDHVGLVESSMLLSSEQTGQRGDIGLDLMTPVNGDQMLIFSCFIYRNVRVEVGCEVWGRGDGAEYVSARKTSDYDVWHNVRIEVDPETRVTFHVDGQNAGTYRPPDAEELKDNVFTFRLKIYSPKPDGITANYDDVRIGYLK